MNVWYSITLATDDWIRRVGKLGDVDLPPLRVLLTRPLPFHLLSPSLSAVAFASVIYVDLPFHGFTVYFYTQLQQ